MSREAEAVLGTCHLLMSPECPGQRRGPCGPCRCAVVCHQGVLASGTSGTL